MTRLCKSLSKLKKTLTKINHDKPDRFLKPVVFRNERLMKTITSNLAPMERYPFLPVFGRKDIADSGTSGSFQNEFSAPDKSYKL